MSLLEPLWLLWVDIPLALLAGLLWWSIQHMDPVPPLVDIQNSYRPRPISRYDVTNLGPITAASASSASWTVMAATSVGPPR